MQTQNRIPSLGETAQAVLDAAFTYPLAGFSLVFQTVFDGEYRAQIDGVFQTEWHGNIPTIGRKVDDEFLARRIRAGEMSIFVQSPGRRPHYRLELHRATGRQIPA